MNTQQLQRQLQYSKKQTAYAWAKYYEERETAHTHDTNTFQSLINVEQQQDMPTHIVEELKELSTKLKKKIECPICLEIIDINFLSITKCGHKYCSPCLTQLKNNSNKCAVCRRKIK